MSITVRCACGAKLAAKDDLAGKTLRCPKCSSGITVPFPEAAQSDDDAPISFDSSPSALSLSTPESPSPFYSSRTKQSRFGAIIPILALALSVIALVIPFIRDPLGKGMNAYDFSTPKSALESITQIEANGDARALLDLAFLKQGRHSAEKLRTLKVHRESEYNGSKILFVSYEQNGISKFDTAAFEKDATSGMWYSKFVSTYSMDDAVLEKAISEWTSKGGKVEE